MKKTKKVLLSMSGAGFAIPSLAGASYQLLENGLKPNVVAGVSSGSIMTYIICASSDPKKVILENATGFKSKDVFNKPPINKKGKLTPSAYFNGFFHNYLAKQNKLYDLLGELVSEYEWVRYINNPLTPIGIIMSVDFLTGKREFFNLKDYDYNTARKLVQASCSIPVFANPIDFNGKLLFDGGVRNHILTEWIFDNYKIDESHSIFSRAEKFTDYTTKDKLKNLPEVLLRTIEIMEFEISKSDEQLADLKAEKMNIKHKNYYIKNILDNVYDDSIKKQQELFQYGINVVNQK